MGEEKKERKENSEEKNEGRGREVRRERGVKKKEYTILKRMMGERERKK